MRALIVLAIALSLGAVVMWVAQNEAGFVLLQYGSWSLETSLIVFIVAMLILLVSGYMLLRSLFFIRKSPQRLSQWQQNQRLRRASSALTRGLITLEEGRWAEAERTLVRHAGNSQTPLLHYLAAARAAQKQGESERRDNYLRLAHETTEGADIAVGVVQAELQLSAGQKEQALATLQHLREMSPKHPYVLQLIQKLYQDMEQWQDVQNVLPDLRKRRVLEATEVTVLDQDASAGQLQSAIEQKDWAKFAEVWQGLPNKARHSEPLLKLYTEGLILQGEGLLAAELIEQFMRKQWSDILVEQYGLIEEGDVFKRLGTAEKWLDGQQENATLLLCLGRLAVNAELWAKAQAYLEQSLRVGPRGETYQLMAKVHRAEQQFEAAAASSEAGLDFMLSQK